jgi:hypothetical protein
MVISKKFGVPEFVKYTGTQCPVTHLKVYCNKMAEVVDDEKLLIHFFSRQFKWRCPHLVYAVEQYQG